MNAEQKYQLTRTVGARVDLICRVIPAGELRPPDHIAALVATGGAGDAVCEPIVYGIAPESGRE